MGAISNFLVDFFAFPSLLFSALSCPVLSCPCLVGWMAGCPTGWLAGGAIDLERTEDTREPKRVETSERSSLL